MMDKFTQITVTIVVATISMYGCSDSGTENNQVLPTQVTTVNPTVEIDLDVRLRESILSNPDNETVASLILPDSDDLDSIPQDPNNPLSDAKVVLGKALFHDTGLATNGNSSETNSWSCATCHHAAAGFKSGVTQGIGEGGTGFGVAGQDRFLAEAFDANAEATAANKPDIQPFTSPTVLNVAYQDVMLWNGQFGNSANGLVNQGITESILSRPGTPKAENSRGLSGIETQAIAGMDVHRLSVTENSVVQTSEAYQALFTAAYEGGSQDVKSDAGKSIAAFERTVLANRAPFQLWLRGDTTAMSDSEKQGGILFFSKGGCSDCHQGPALSSNVGASEDQMFMAIGFADFQPGTQDRVHGPITDADKLGRGGFTEEESDNYKFKIPQLYNLIDTAVFGHGGSFSSVREVLEYKNSGIAQNQASVDSLDSRFIPLSLTSEELDQLEAFLKFSLYDPELMRYQPDTVPSGECVVVDPLTIDSQGLCPDTGT